jgi:membrane-bound lytic murein transglycosylase A
LSGTAAQHALERLVREIPFVEGKVVAEQDEALPAPGDQVDDVRQADEIALVDLDHAEPILGMLGQQRTDQRAFAGSARPGQQHIIGAVAGEKLTGVGEEARLLGVDVLQVCQVNALQMADRLQPAAALACAPAMGVRLPVGLRRSGRQTGFQATEHLFGAFDQACKIRRAHCKFPGKAGLSARSEPVYFRLSDFSQVSSEMERISKRQERVLWSGLLVAWLGLAACTTTPVADAPPTPARAAENCPAVTPAVCPACPKCTTAQPPEAAASAPAAAPFREVSWSELPDWQRDDLTQALPSLLASCKAIRVPEIKAVWIGFCEAAQGLGPKPASAQIRALLEQWLTPYQVINADGSQEGLITGYYEPLIRGSRWKSARFPVAVHGVPEDILNIDMSEVYPETKSMRLRGRLEGKKILPYWSRAQIEAQGERFPAKILLWAADPLDFFFLQVQGSGQVELSDGSRIRLAYADQNGHPSKSIGRWLVDKGELKLDQASMQGIQAWVKANPARLSELLNANPSYVFFREEVANGEGPKGSLGVPLVATRAIAVDPRSIPLGTPVYLATTRPDGSALHRLVAAQDTGGAIRGRVRADFFWGFGSDAGAQAGRMRSQGKLWVLWPKGATL